VQTKAAETQATRAKYQASRFETAGWNHSGDYSGGADALEIHFQQETQEELEQLKQKYGALTKEGGSKEYSSLLLTLCSLRSAHSCDSPERGIVKEMKGAVGG